MHETKFKTQRGHGPPMNEIAVVSQSLTELI